jgi:lambda family phage tail tape measure protein
MQNAQKIVAVYEDAQYTMNEAQKRMVSLATDPRFLEESQKNQQKIMIELVKASNEINEKSRFQYGDKETLSLEKETRALEDQGKAIGMTDEARIRAAAASEALNKRLEEEAFIRKQAWSETDKELETMAALERYNQRIANADIAVANMLKAERINAYGAAFESVFNGMADAITTFVTTGKLSFKGLIDGMLTDLIRFEMRAQSMAIYRSLGGVGGIMNTLTGAPDVPSDINTSGFGTSNYVKQANGGAWDSGVQMFAKGGSFTNSIVDSPTLFKFAKGTGMMGEAGPEAIMPLRRGADGSLGVQAQGGGSNVQISVINNTTAQATTHETTDSKGNRKVEVIIGDMTASEMSRNGSSSQKALKSTFGLQPALIRR